MIGGVRGLPLVPLALLLAYAAAFGSRSLGQGLLVYDDHPGQLYRLWHAVHAGLAPWTWNGGWWTGYPELQFYPPGFAYAGALLVHGSLGSLSLEAVYQVLLWVTWVAPGLATWLVLARLLGNGWLALPGAFVALTLSSGMAGGVEGGLHIGMVAARLAAALLPLLVLALAGWIEGRPRPSAWATVLVAAIVLVHPVFLPAAVVLLLLAARTGTGAPARRARLGQAGLILALAAGLTAFWTWPLLARLEHTRALAWGRLSLDLLASTLAGHPLLVVLLGLAVMAGRSGGPRAAVVVARLPWAVALVVAATALLLEPLGLRWLPADRMMDGVWIAVVLAAGLGCGELIDGAGRRWRLPRPAGALAATVLLAAISVPGGALTLWPRALDWPTLEATERGLRLGDLWAALRQAPPGRVLFVRSGVPLVHGTEWYRPHTHITSLAPVRSGRPIVHGTFTHPSPTATIVYRGSPVRQPVTRLAEELDGHVLFGRSLEALDPATFNAYVDALGVSVVVVLDEDVPRLRALEDNPGFAPAVPSRPFVLHTRRTPATIPTAVSPDRWRVTLTGEAGAWRSTRMAYYPLWTATAGGRGLETREGAMADLEVRLDRAGPVVVDLHYAPALAEFTGVAVTALTLAASALLWTRKRRVSRVQGRTSRPPPRVRSR
jgi:hypothetical protein